MFMTTVFTSFLLVAYHLLWYYPFIHNEYIGVLKLSSLICLTIFFTFTTIIVVDQLFLCKREWCVYSIRTRPLVRLNRFDDILCAILILVMIETLNVTFVMIAEKYVPWGDKWGGVIMTYGYEILLVNTFGLFLYDTMVKYSEPHDRLSITTVLLILFYAVCAMISYILFNYFVNVKNSDLDFLSIGLVFNVSLMLAITFLTLIICCLKSCIFGSQIHDDTHYHPRHHIEHKQERDSDSVSTSMETIGTLEVDMFSDEMEELPEV